ncbi:MAG: BspA family leucine-rich repeat surface protein [Mangrovibacterium sp.]
MTRRLSILFWATLSLLLLFSTCQKEDFQNENSPQAVVEETEEITIEFSTRGGATEAANAVQDAVLSNMRIFTSDQATNKMDAELYDITRNMEDSKLSSRVKTGDWDVTLVSALGDFSVETFNTSQTAGAQTMFRYSPAETLGVGHEQAPQIFTGYETSVPTIMTDQTTSISSDVARNVAKVQVHIKSCVGNIDMTSTEHQIFLHHVPSRIAYDGSLMPNATTPDTLTSAIYGFQQLHTSDEGERQGVDTLDFIIPAHRGDFSSDESKHSSHKMKISVRMKCTDGTWYESGADIPLVARCNEILQLNLNISAAVEIEAGIHPWIESEHDLELVQTAFTVSKSMVRMQAADEIWVSSNDPITLDYTGMDSWLTVVPNGDNTHLTLTAKFSDYTDPRSTSFTIKSGRLEKRITVEQLLPSGDFTSTWHTTMPNEIVNLPLHPDGEYDCTVDWGDGSTPTYLNQSAYNSSQAQHKYVAPGTYTVKISGKFEGFCFANDPTADSPAIRASQMKEITNWGSCEFLDAPYQFAHTAIEQMETADEPNLAPVSTMAHWFYQATSFTGEGIADWDVSQVKDMSNMFAQAAAFNQDLSRWNVGQVKSMAKMFYVASAFDNGGEALGWGSRTSRVTDMSYMFFSAKAFNQDLSNWDVSKVEKMNCMFNGAAAFNQDVSDWDVSEVKNMFAMFFSAYAFNNGGKALDWGERTKNVTDMYRMFFSAKAFNQAVGDWDVSSVKRMTEMFNAASIFNQDLSNWDVSKVETMEKMFNVALAFDQDLSDWKINELTDASMMFNLSALSTDNYDRLLLSWHDQVKNGNAKSGVVLGAQSTKYCAAKAERQELIDDYGWLISDAGQDAACGTFGTAPFVTVWKGGDVQMSWTTSETHNYAVRTYSMSGELLDEKTGWTDNYHYYNTTGQTGDVRVEIYPQADGSGFPRARMGPYVKTVEQWGDVKWKSMYQMFSGCDNLTSVPGATAAESPDLSECTNLGYVFRSCSNFNSDISGWDVSAVTDMQSVFSSATSFNQDISGWDVSAVTNMQSMFSGASSFNQDIGSWDVSAVTNMQYMFYFASSFNQDISGWVLNPAGVTHVGFDLNTNSAWTSAKKPNF